MSGSTKIVSRIKAKDGDTYELVDEAVRKYIDEDLAECLEQLVTKQYIQENYPTKTSVSDSYALKNSPALTGTPTAPTAEAGTATTQIATTAFVQEAIPEGNRAAANIKNLLAAEISSSGTLYDAIHKRVTNGDYDGLQVGDYIDIPLSNYTDVVDGDYAAMRFVIAHFDPYYRCGDTAIGHHIAFVTTSPIFVSSSSDLGDGNDKLQWLSDDNNNGSATENCPYLISTLKKWENKLEDCLPSSLTQYLLNRRALIESRYSSEGTLTESNDMSWESIGRLWSLSETEIYGQCVWGTKGYSVGADCQFDIFRDSASRLRGERTAYWLRTVATDDDATRICTVDEDGSANLTPQTIATYPRVGFLFG